MFNYTWHKFSVLVDDVIVWDRTTSMTKEEVEELCEKHGFKLLSWEEEKND